MGELFRELEAAIERERADYVLALERALYLCVRDYHDLARDEQFDATPPALADAEAYLRARGLWHVLERRDQDGW